MTYAPQQSTDHADRGPLRLLDQFKNKPKLVGLLRSYLKEIQKIEDAAWEVLYYRTILNGFGIVLDRIGKIVGRPRNSLIDSDYKIALRAQIRINRSSGTPEDIISVAVLSLPVGFGFLYHETYPAAIIASIPQQVTFNILVLFQNLTLCKLGGVRIQLEYTTDPPGEWFLWAPNNVAVTDTAHGWADIDRGSGINAGGRLSSVLDSGSFVL